MIGTLSGFIFRLISFLHVLCHVRCIGISEKLKISNDINVSYSDRNIVGSSGDGYGGNGGSVVRYALFRTPAIPIFNDDGTYTDLPEFPQFFGDGYNPVALAMYTDNREKHSRLLKPRDNCLCPDYPILRSLLSV